MIPLLDELILDGLLEVVVVVSSLIGSLIDFNFFVFPFFVAGDKPHGCDICLKKFALACNLRAHMKTHEGKLVEVYLSSQ